MTRFFVLLSFLSALATQALAQEPEKVQPGVISLDDRNETFPMVDPRDGSLWFSAYEGEWFDGQTIMFARKDSAGGWLPAEVAPFSGTYGDRTPRFSQDGNVLVFTSNRPAEGMPEGDLNLWLVWRNEDGSWREPMFMGPPVASPTRDMHSAFTCDGKLWFASYREGSAGRADIWAGAHGEPIVRVPEPVSGAGGEPDLFMSADGSVMILVATEPEGGKGGDDLLITRLVEGAWTAPAFLEGEINTDAYEYGPTVSPDGWLYFTSHRDGSGDVWRVWLEDVRAGGEALPPIATACPPRE